MNQYISSIGYGEAGSTFARAARWGAAACGFDPRDERRAMPTADGLVLVASAAEPVTRTSLMVSLELDLQLAASR